MTPGPVGRWASESLPHAPGGTVVIKIGGRSLEAPGALDELATEVAALSDGALLVHGGGHEVSDWCARLGVPSSFVDGLRVTDATTLEVAVAVLAGLANKRLVASLLAAGVDAIGLSALDLGIVEVLPHPRAAELGAVGHVTAVHPEFLQSLIADGRTPVLSSIGAVDGALLNLNADDVAAAIAAAIGASTLLLLTDTPGVVLDGEVVATIDLSELDSVIARDDVQGGMVAKLNAARAAIEGGVTQVIITAWRPRGIELEPRRGTTVNTSQPSEARA